MIQDIEPHKFSNEYRPVPPDESSCLLYYRGREVLIRWDGEEIRFPCFKDLEDMNAGLYEGCTYLFAIDGVRFYLAKDITYPLTEEYRMENTEIFRTALPRFLAFAGITGYQLYKWYSARKFCGHCGKAMVHSQKERMMYCPECRITEYPKISPAVIVGVTHGNKLLMSKYANRDFNKYALIAGFTEIGETIEETVRREVMEEVGLKVKNIRYYKSQPWSFTDTLLFGFFAELDGDETITLDREELAMAEWFERESIPVRETNLSLTNEMIIKFKKGEV